jgi:hypothetical protein
VEIVGYVLLAVIVLWFLARVPGWMVERKMNRTDGARMIRAAVSDVGHFNGTAYTYDRAVAAYIDLAENGPFDLDAPVPISALARGCADNMTPQSGPILLETAWAVVGAYRHAYPGDEGPPPPRRARGVHHLVRRAVHRLDQEDGAHLPGRDPSREARVPAAHGPGHRAAAGPVRPAPGASEPLNRPALITALRRGPLIEKQLYTVAIEETTHRRRLSVEEITRLMVACGRCPTRGELGGG